MLREDSYLLQGQLNPSSLLGRQMSTSFGSSAGKAKACMVHSVSGCTRVVQVKL